MSLMSKEEARVSPRSRSWLSEVAQGGGGLVLSPTPRLSSRLAVSVLALAAAVSPGVKQSAVIYQAYRHYRRAERGPAQPGPARGAAHRS